MHVPKLTNTADGEHVLAHMAEYVVVEDVPMADQVLMWDTARVLKTVIAEGGYELVSQSL